MNGEDWEPQMCLSPLQKSCEDVCKTKSQIVRERRSSQIGCSFVVSETVALLLRFTVKFTKLSRKTFPGLIVLSAPKLVYFCTVIHHCYWGERFVFSASLEMRFEHLELSYHYYREYFLMF